jgi:hypothetical protein
MEGREHALLTCVSCGEESEHALTYAGRLLVSTECLSCGFTWHHSDHDLRSAYLHDLESRIVSKPRRWLDRLRREPLKTALALPSALARQPGKFIREIRTVLKN